VGACFKFIRVLTQAKRRCRMWIERLFKISSVLIGFVAAVLWMLSASVDIPLSPGAAIGVTSPREPFNVAMQKAAFLNKRAAFATGLSTLLLVIAEGIGQWATLRAARRRADDTHKS
jgi:hypothetical protein